MRKITTIEKFNNRILAALIAALMCVGFIFGGMPIRKAVAEDIDALQSLIDGAAVGDTVTLDREYSGTVTVAADKDVTVDLAGHTLNGRLVNNGALKLKSSADNGAIVYSTAESGSQAAVENNGTLTFESGEISMTVNGDNTEGRGILNGNGATLEMRGGVINVVTTTTKWGFGIFNNGGTIADISGGEITSRITHTNSGSNAVAINNQGTVERISGGEIYAEHGGGSGYAAALRGNSGTIENITGGSFEAKTTGSGKAVGLYFQGGILDNLGGGDIYAYNPGSGYAEGIYISSGAVNNISGGTVYAYADNGSADNNKAFGIDIEANGKVGAISGGDITGKSDAMQWAFGIWNKGTIESIDGGTISAVVSHNNANTSPNAIAISYDANATIKSVSGGTFYAFSAHSKGGAIGIRARSNIASVTGGALYINKINNNHYFLIEGSGAVTYGDGYGLSEASANSYRYVLGSGQTYTEEYKDDALIMTATVKGSDNSVVKEYKLIGTELGNAAFIGKVGYASVTDAVAAASDGDTVTVGKNADEDIVVSADKNVNIDFDGYRITGKLTNNGAVTLTTSKDGGMLYRSSTGSGLDAVVYNYGTLRVDGLNIRNDGINNSAQADGIYNYSGGKVYIDGGIVRGAAYGTTWAHAIVNEGELYVSGGDIQTLALNTENSANIVAVSMTGSGKMEMTGGSVYSQSYGKGGTAIGVRTQGSAQVKSITGGTVRSVACNPVGTCEAYGIYLEGAASEVNIDGGEVIGETYNDYTFGVFNKGTLNVGGGRIYAAAYHGQKAPNIIGISAEASATTNISGGYTAAYKSSAETNNSTYAVRNRGNLTVSGGVFGYNREDGRFILTDGGTTDYTEGIKLAESEVFDRIAYAVADGDVVVEQRGGEKFIGVNVYRNGEAVFMYNDRDGSGRPIGGFMTADGMVISKDELSELDGSAVVDAIYNDVPTYLFLGSSVTYGHANKGSSFVNYVASNADCIVIKEAVSGTTLADNGAKSYVSRLLANVDKKAKIDHLIVQLSTNDATQNQPLGALAATKNIEDFDRTTTVGAMEFIIAYARKTWGCKVSFYTNPVYNNANYERLIAQLDLVKAKWGIGVVDFYRYVDMDALDPATLASYMADAIHPNAQGYEWMGEVFTDYLKKNG